MVENKKCVECIAITKKTPLSVIKKLGSECNRCGCCCSLDSGLVLEQDIPRIVKFLRMSEQIFKEKYLVPHERFNTTLYKLKQVKEKGNEQKPYGKCVFLDENKLCKIHVVKPLHCQVCSTKSKIGTELANWFALNYLVNPNDPESIRQWASFLKENKTIAGGQLHDLVQDRVKLARMLNYEILK